MAPNWLGIMSLVGASGIIAQVLILRELLVGFQGNELVLGVILANWVLWEALGALIIAGIVDRKKNEKSLFLLLELVFCLSLPFSIYLARTFKYYLGISFGQTVGIPAVFLISLLANAGVGLSHGGLFTCGAALFAAKSGKDKAGIGSVYGWETIGTLAGGLVLTYLCIPFLNSFQTAAIVSVLNLLVCFIIGYRFMGKWRGRLLLRGAFVLLMLLFTISPVLLQRFSLQKQWPKRELLEYRNSWFGNIAVTRQEGQYTFFYNGNPIITTPIPDIAFAEEFSHLPLLFHAQPKDIMVISHAVGGIIAELTQYPLQRIDYAEPDPELIAMVKDYPTALTAAELKDKRVRLIFQDARFLLKEWSSTYDVVLLGLQSPTDLSTNRFFTLEFFNLVKKRLNQGGIFGFCLPGSLTYISPEMRDLNFCIWNALREAFPYVRVIPGDAFNLYLASSSDGVLSQDAFAIAGKMNHYALNTKMLSPSYLEYRLAPHWHNWFLDSTKNATSAVNKDQRPYALFQMELLWNKQFSPWFYRVLKNAGSINTNGLVFFLVVMALVLFCIAIIKKRLRPNLYIGYAIFSTGFFGMMMSLMLIFSYQIACGYLYHMIGILICSFMAGSAAGSLIMERSLRLKRCSIKTFWSIELAIVLFSAGISLFLPAILKSAIDSVFIFITLSICSGLFLGLEFPLASFLFAAGKKSLGKTVGILFWADLMGGWFAGITAGVLFLPVLGLFNTCLLVTILKLTSSLLLFAGTPNFPISSRSSN